MTQIAEKPNRVQGMARSVDEWRAMEPLDVVTGSHAECALHDAKNDIEFLWRKVTSQAAEIERLREALENMIGHAKWVAAEFDVHYAHLAECEAALSAPNGAAHE